MPRGSDRGIDAEVEGTATSQVAVGENIVQTGEGHGDLVLRAALAERPVPQPLPSPVVLRPRAFSGLLDREEELQEASEALQAGQSISLHGEEGLGKSALLRRIAYLPEADAFPDGVIHIPALHLQEADLRQEVFSAFHECPFPTKPTELQIQQALEGKQALVLLDDVRLSPEEAEALLSAAPQCTFVLSGEERLLSGDGCDLPLGGLPLEAAMALVGRELGRPLAADEPAQARAICEALKGHPLRIMQAVAAVREERRSFAALAVAARSPAPAPAVAASIFDTFSEPQRHVLFALAALDGAPTGAGHIGAVAENEDAAAELELLQRLNLVQEHGLQYRLAGVSAASLPGAPDLARWVEKALGHFASWGERLARSPRAIMGESAAMVALISRGAAMAQWGEVLRLVRVVEGPLTLAGRWQTRQTVLAHGLTAARALGDRAAEAWALHQAGVRALSLGDSDEARGLLTQALEIRRSLGDQVGAAVTKQNLDIASGTIPPPEIEPPDDEEFVAPTSAGVVALKVFSVLLVLAAAGFLVLRALAPPRLIDLRVRPQTVDGGGFTALTVTLNKEAPQGGLDVTLASSESVVQVPIRVRVPGGSRKRSVLIGTKPVAFNTRVTLTAMSEESLQAAGLEVRPMGERVGLRLTLTPRIVTGGGPVEGTVDLEKPASSEGLAAVQSSEERVARGPTSVSVPPGAEQVRFRLDTSKVGQATPVTVTVSYAGVSRSVELRVEPGPAQLAAVAFERPSITAGTRVVGTITLTGPAPEGGTAVDLSPSDRAVEVASPVTVPEGKTSARFAAAASEVEARRTVQVTASLGTQSRRADLVVEPQGPQLVALDITPGEVSGGARAEGVVRLAQEAPRDITVRLSSNTSALTMPQTVTVARGKREVGFAVQTTQNTRLVEAMLTATYGSFARSARLRLLPVGISLAGVSLDRSRVKGGETVSGLVTLSDPATESVTVTLKTSHAAAKVPRRVTVPVGGLSAPFAVRTAEVKRPVTARVTASWGGASRNASLVVSGVAPPAPPAPEAPEAPVTVAAARLETLVATPQEVHAGSHIGVLVRLDRAVPEGAEVRLATDHREITVPATVRIEPKQREGTAVAGTEGVGETMSATITASYGGVTKETRVRVTAAPRRAQLVDLSLSPARVRAGEAATGVVALSAPAVGAVEIDLAAESRWVRVPKQVTVQAGSTSARFQAATDSKLPGSLPVVISATLSATTKTAVLTIEGEATPAQVELVSLSVTPATVPGGKTATGTVTLSGNAPAATAVILVADSRVASVPRQIVVAAGRRSRGFAVATGKVTDAQTVTISASWRGARRTASLTVTPTPSEGPKVALQDLFMSAARAGGGTTLTGTVRLSGRASEAVTVDLSAVRRASNGRWARVECPKSVTVPRGRREATFGFTVPKTPGIVPVTISASYGGVTQAANLTAESRE